MQFDTTTLPDKLWLILCEAITWHAFGEALDRNDAYNFPGDRKAQIQGTTQAEAERLVTEQARALDEAMTAVGPAMLAGKVLFNGVHEGKQETIDPVVLSDAPSLQWTLDMVTTTSDPWSAHGGRPLQWAAVRVERASFVGWINGQTAATPRKKRKPGSKPYYNKKVIAEMARRIAANPQVPSVTPPTEKLIDKVQKLHRKKYPNAQCPSRSTVQRIFDEYGLP